MKGIIIWIIIQAMMIIQKKKKRLNFSAIELLIYHLCVLINGKNNHHGVDAVCSNFIVTK